MGTYLDDDDSVMFKIELSREEFRNLMHSPPEGISIEIDYMDEFALTKGYLSYDFRCENNEKLKIYAISLQGRWYLFGKTNDDTEHIYNLIKTD